MSSPSQPHTSSTTAGHNPIDDPPNDDRTNGHPPPDLQSATAETSGDPTDDVVDGDYVLVVDDSRTQQAHLAGVLRDDGLQSMTVGDGPTAIDQINRRLPIVVITDLEMPGMSGLELVQTLRGTHPSLPVVLTTSRGSEDVAAEALRHGAASYVPKRHVQSSLATVVRQVITAGETIRSVQSMGRFATRSSITLRIDNDETLVAKVISRFELTLIELGTFDDGCRMQVAMALDEAILNAIVHGNLEVDSVLREQGDGSGYQSLIEKRRVTEPYASRRVTVSLDATTDAATFVVRDEGPGFDPNHLCDATDQEHIEGLGGRGMLMINAFMDKVFHNECGNELTMVKMRSSC